jgi:TfoX/Sxy family transcriptional regulator of competence genes
VAFDEALAARVREALAENADISERQMFGGIAFMLSGNMAVGVSKEDLMVRIDPDDQEEALAHAGVRPFDMTGRPMKGWILVDPEATAEDSDLAQWITRGLDFAGSLRPK